MRKVVQRVVAGFPWRWKAVGFIEGGFPQSHPFGVRFAAVREAVYFGGVEEFRGEASKTAMSADGASEGGEGL